MAAFSATNCAAVLLGSRLSLLCDVELSSREGVYYMLKKYNTAVMYKAHSRWAMVRERSICEKSVLVPCYCGCLRVYEERRRCPLVRIKHRAARKNGKHEKINSLLHLVREAVVVVEVRS